MFVNWPLWPLPLIVAGVCLWVIGVSNRRSRFLLLPVYLLSVWGFLLLIDVSTRYGMAVLFIAVIAVILLTIGSSVVNSQRDIARRFPIKKPSGSE